MAFTYDDWLPTYEELDVQEIELTAAPLRAGAHHFGKYCDNQCKEFMLCNAEEKDPRKCLNEGKEVTRCGLEFYQKVKQHCADEFTKYWRCIDYASHKLELNKCRKTQYAFDKCVLEKLGQERPYVGYFSKVRVHHTNRPKPEVHVEMPEPFVHPPKYNPKDPVPEVTKRRPREFL